MNHGLHDETDGCSFEKCAPLLCALRQSDVEESESREEVQLHDPPAEVGCCTEEAVDAAIEAAIRVGREKFGSRVPMQPKTVIHDGDGLSPTGKEYSAEAKGHWVFTASLPESRGPVDVVDLGRNPIMNQSEIYSGMFVNVLVNFYFYANESMGVGAGLGPVQKVADGEPLGGKLPSADDVFGAPEAPQAGGYTYQTPAAAAPVPPAAYAAAAGASVNPVTGAPM